MYMGGGAGRRGGGGVLWFRLFRWKFQVLRPGKHLNICSNITAVALAATACFAHSEFNLPKIRMITLCHA